MMFRNGAKILLRWVAALCLLGFVLVWPLPVEAAKVQYLLKSWNGPALRVFLTRPVGLAPDRPVVFVMHGMNRNAVQYRDQWHDLANQYDFLLVVPEFMDRKFPGSEAYSLGNVFDDQGKVRDESEWSYAAIEAIFDDLHLRFGVLAENYSLYGHAEGAEFVQGYIFHVAQTRADRIVVANAGGYMMPDFEVPFPRGLKDSASDEARLAGALQLPLTILLGTGDGNAGDLNLPDTTQAISQGEAFIEGARVAAEKKGIPFNWKLVRVEGAGENNYLMAPAAIPFLLNQ
jgi:hypothetical protein